MVPRSRAARDFLRAPVLLVQRAALDGLVDRADELRCSASAVSASPASTAACEAAEVGLDRRRVAAVLEPLALGAQDPLLLGGMLAMTWKRRGLERTAAAMRAAY